MGVGEGVETLYEVVGPNFSLNQSMNYDISQYAIISIKYKYTLVHIS